MLKETERNEGGNPNQLHDVTNSPPILEELGISKIQSHHWQTEASVPDNDNKTREGGDSVSIKNGNKWKGY